jgi:hypothetical protein
MKRIREIDLAKINPSKACCVCEQNPTEKSGSLWIQVGFKYICQPCGRQNGQAL